MSAVFSQRMSLDDVDAVYLSNMGNLTRQKEEAPQQADLQRHEKTQQIDDIASSPPPLPERNARRSSRFLDALLDSKKPSAVVATAVAVSLNTADAAQPTPHDVYLSSEEDASSLGDFSDYDYEDDEFSVEEVGTYEVATGAPLAATASISNASAPSEHSSQSTNARRHSHDVARVVSVVFSGKPSLVDLAAERQSRRRSLQERATSPSASFSSVSSSAAASYSNNTRPSTSSGSLLSSAPSSTNSSPKTHKRVHSGSMLASFRARKNAMANIDSCTDSSSYPLPKMAAMPEVPTPTAFAAPAPSPAPDASLYISAAAAPVPQAARLPCRSLTTSMVGSASNSSSPRTPTFNSNLFKGVTRTLTKSRRRPQLRDNAAAPAVPAIPAAISPAPPSFLDGLSPRPDSQCAFQEPATYNDIIQSARRKSLAMSVVTSMTAMNAPPPAPPMPDLDYANLPARSFTPPTPLSATVESRKTVSSFFGRRRSLKLL